MTKSVVEPKSQPAADTQLAAQWAQLTPRQQQILTLLKAGKVNKEIAQELGIGLGTVKQHMVTLFKKLQVRNRTMAVSQDLQNAQPASAVTPAPVVVTGVLERRPCVVLCLLLTEQGAAERLAQVQQALQAFVMAHQALLLMRKEQAVELIFGLQTCTDFDVYKAYRAADKIYRLLDCEPSLRAGVAAGMAIVSMSPKGDCTGEVIASAVIGQARELAETTAIGTLKQNEQALSLCQLAQPGRIGAASVLALNNLQRMPINSQLPLPVLFGCDELMQQLTARSQTATMAQKNLLALQGETGMGKSLLFQHWAFWYQSQGGSVLHWVCLPSALGGQLYVAATGDLLSGEQALLILQALAAEQRGLVLIDDCQYLAADSLDAMLQWSFHAKNSLCVFAGRRLAQGLQRHAEVIKLSRLSDDAALQLLAHHAPSADATLLQHWLQLAQGVPLFLECLARHQAQSEAVPLALQVVIAARMDGFKLDRRLLAWLAKQPTQDSIDAIAKGLAESPHTIDLLVAKALASGVLCQNQQRLSFSHPLLRLAVVQSLVE